MVSGFAYPLLALLLWGVWAVIIKYTALEVGPIVTALSVNLVAFPLYIGYALYAGEAIVPEDWNVLPLLLLAGLCSAGASLAYYVGLSRGVDISIMSTVSSLYFMVPVVFGVLLYAEVITLREGVGVLAAVVAVYLLA